MSCNGCCNTLPIAAGGASELNDLTDVTITAVADCDVLKYNAGTGEWENTPYNTFHELQDHSNVTGDDPFLDVYTSVQQVLTVDEGTGNWTVALAPYSDLAGEQYGYNEKTETQWGVGYPYQLSGGAVLSGQTYTRTADNTTWVDYAFLDGGNQYTEVSLEPDKTYEIGLSGLVSALQTEVGYWRLVDTTDGKVHSVKADGNFDFQDHSIVITPVLQNIQADSIIVKTSSEIGLGGDATNLYTGNRTFRLQFAFSSFFDTPGSTFQLLEDYGIMLNVRELQNETDYRTSTLQ